MDSFFPSVLSLHFPLLVRGLFSHSSANAQPARTTNGMAGCDSDCSRLHAWYEEIHQDCHKKGVRYF
jgi:hypothetical protein